MVILFPLDVFLCKKNYPVLLVNPEASPPGQEVDGDPAFLVSAPNIFFIVAPENTLNYSKSEILKSLTF